MVVEILNSILKELRRAEYDTKELWSSGAYTHPTMEGTVQANAKALGYIEAVNDIINFIEQKIDEVKLNDDSA